MVPIDAMPAEAETIKKDFRRALRDNGLVVHLVTTSLFSDPASNDAAFHSPLDSFFGEAAGGVLHCPEVWVCD